MELENDLEGKDRGGDDDEDPTVGNDLGDLYMSLSQESLTLPYSQHPITSGRLGNLRQGLNDSIRVAW